MTEEYEAKNLTKANHTKLINLIKSINYKDQSDPLHVTHFFINHDLIWIPHARQARSRSS